MYLVPKYLVRTNEKDLAEENCFGEVYVDEEEQEEGKEEEAQAPTKKKAKAALKKAVKKKSLK